MTATVKGLSTCRQRLLDAARGSFLGGESSAKRRILRCFPLKERHFKSPSLSIPIDFHATLCSKICAADRRVYLASLYIGPAANPVASVKESELLRALQTTAAPDIKILLDRNRALRPVPVIEGEATTISSAEACFRVLEPKLRQNSLPVNSAGVYLLTVLPAWQQLVLTNPYNEVAGVFHLKCYIVDDDIILTGANLSEEYFCDRTDRYLWITSDGDGRRHEPEDEDSVASDHTNSLVECYAALVEVLCRHAEPYTSSTAMKYPPRTRQELLDSLVTF